MAEAKNQKLDDTGTEKAKQLMKQYKNSQPTTSASGKKVLIGIVVFILYLFVVFPFVSFVFLPHFKTWGGFWLYDCYRTGVRYSGRCSKNYT
jgi:Cu/Ag efflux pump CusA